MKEALSIRLLRTLTKGKEQLSAEALALVSQFVEGQKVEGEVAFKNKSGEGDLYYTVFGWLLSYVLGLELEAKQRKAFLDRWQAETLGLIDYAALMRCYLLDELMTKGKWRLTFTGIQRRTVRALESFKELPQGDVHSPYSRFIWWGLLEDTGNMNEPMDLSGLEAYRVPGKGYANAPAKEGTHLNATTAALSLRGQASGWKRSAEVEALREMQEDNGGFKASEAVPMADLLSTATALFVLQQYGVTPCFNAADFITSHWLDNGGFAATLLDETSDVEYVFYGLLALGTL